MTTCLSTLLPSFSGAATSLDSILGSWSWPDWFSSPLLLANTVLDLKDKPMEVLNIIMLFGFLYGTIRIMGGAAQIRRGEIEEGKSAIISGALIAAAPLIMRILFEILFNSTSSLFGA